MADRPARPASRGQPDGPPRSSRTPRGPGASARGPRRRPSRAVHALRRVVALGVIVLAAAIVYFVIEIYQPFAGTGHGRTTVSIPEGADTSRIAHILAGDGVISSAFFFELRARLEGGRMYAGQFTMPLGTSFSRALQILSVEPALRSTDVTIIDGLSRRQVAGRLRASGIKGNYLAATVRSPLLDPARYGAPKRTPYLEGFLYPDTYQLRLPVNVHALVADQLTTFRRRFATVNFAYARSRHLSEYDVLIIASMVEAEATKTADRPLVAAVIYNRLADGMELGFDTTVAYATGDYSGNLTQRELNSSSPWNTTNHKGLPPTPIDSPTLEAIDAAAHPAHTSALYFITKVCGDGRLTFTSSYARFQQLSAAYNTAYTAHGLRGAEFCRR